MNQLTELRPTGLYGCDKMVDLFKQIITGVPGRRSDCLSSF